MTDAQKMLALARAVYPDIAWEAHKCPEGVVGNTNPTDCAFNDQHVRFDPARNNSQFCDVLAWLLNQRDAPADPLFTILDDDAPPVTAAGLRQAVTDAAVRVIHDQASRAP